MRAFVVEEQTGAGTDLFAGVIRSDDLDPVLVVGLGGAIVEQAVAVAGARLPLDRKDAEDLLDRSGLGASLRAARADGAALGAVAIVLHALSDLALALGPRLRAVDVNPLRVLADGERPVVALDALVELWPSS